MPDIPASATAGTETRISVWESRGWLLSGPAIWYAVSCAVALVDVMHDLRAVGGMQSSQGSVEVRLIRGVDRVKHAAKPMVKRVFEVQRAPQHVIGRTPLLVKKQRVEPRDRSRELLDQRNLLRLSIRFEPISKRPWLCADMGRGDFAAAKTRGLPVTWQKMSPPVALTKSPVIAPVCDRNGPAWYC